jgi:hypothetical protein
LLQLVLLLLKTLLLALMVMLLPLVRKLQSWFLLTTALFLLRLIVVGVLLL